MTIKIDDATIDKIRLEEQSGDPTTPASGHGYLYAKANSVYFKDDNGEVTGPFGFGIVPGGRLTLETGEPVSTSDQSAKATLYYTPYQHNVISLYANSKWNPVQFTEKNITLVGLTASRPYDVWGYLSNGTLALELLAWTDGTNRATALAKQDGIYIKSGDATRRYLGTIYINSTGGQTEDTEIARFVWNYYNRVIRNLEKIDDTEHAYNGVYRYFNNDATNKVEFFIGVGEDAFFASFGCRLKTTNVSAEAILALGLDSPTVVMTGLVQVRNADTVYLSASNNSYRDLTETFGYHYISGLEQCNGVNGTFTSMRIDCSLLG